MKKITLLTGLLLMIIGSCIAQPGFSTYSNTISGGHIRNCIEVDALGNKWYGSSKGIYKFDGTTWTNFNITNSAIPSNSVSDISFDASNNLWASTRAGLVKFDGTTWTTYNVAGSGIANDTGNCVFNEGSNVWVGTKQGLSVFDGAAWTTYNTANSGLINNNVTAVNITAAGDVWVGTATGLCIKTGSGWITYNNDNSNFVSAGVTSIWFESPSIQWIGTLTFGVFKCENGIFTPFSSIALDKPMQTPNAVYTITKGPQGGALFYGMKDFITGYGFYEVTGTQIYFYPLPFSMSSRYQALDPATNIVWFVASASGSTNAMYSFDYSAFAGTLTISPDPNAAFLDVNQVRAQMLNRGDMHWNLSHAAYEVPKNSGRNAIFASSLWIGGLDAGSVLHQAAMTYRQTGNDYWPGPLDTITATTDSVTSAAYDKIWKLDRWEIDEFRTMFANGSVTAGTYIPAYNIVNWPAHGGGAYTHNMAPFVDVNGDGIYNPMGDGDYPKIKGDQMCYWVFNDNLHVHTETGGQALRVEIHASAYAYNCDSIADSLKALNYTTFYDYEIYNRGVFPYHDVYTGLWQDGDLGGYNDDYVGCSPSGNYSFQYNGDNVDEGLAGIMGYGSNPPMISNVILNGPPALLADGVDNDNDGVTDEAGEKDLMTNVLNYNNNTNPKNGNPGTAQDFYNYMHSTWRDGTHATYGGDGTGGGSPYNFMFDGIPGPAGWSEVSENDPFVDRRIVMTCGPFNLDPGAHVNFSFATVFTRNSAPVYNFDDLFTSNRNDIDHIRQWYLNDNFPSCDPVLATGINTHATAPVQLSIYPNPATNVLYVGYSGSASYTLDIYSVTGQLMQREKVTASHVAIDVNRLPDGLYIVKVSDGKSMKVQRFVKQ